MWRVILAIALVLKGAVAMAAESAWTTVRCAASSSFLINAKGDLYATGRRAAGNLGDRRKGASPSFIKKWEKTLTRVADVSSAFDHSAALRSNGTIWLAGTNQHGEIGRPQLTRINSDWKKAKLPTRAKVVGVAAGGFSSYAVTSNGALWVVGWSELGTQTQPSDPQTEKYYNPAWAHPYSPSGDALRFSTAWKKTLSRVTRVSATLNGAYAWRTDGSVFRIAYYADTYRQIIPRDLTIAGARVPQFPPTRWRPVTLVAGIVAAKGDAPQLLSDAGDLYSYSDFEADGIPDDQQPADGVIDAKPASNYLTGSGITAADVFNERELGFGQLSLTKTNLLQHWVAARDDEISSTRVPAHWEPALDQVRSFAWGMATPWRFGRMGRSGAQVRIVRVNSAMVRRLAPTG